MPSKRTRAQVEADTAQTREAITRLLLEHVLEHPLARPLKARQIHAHFPHLSIQAVYWHMDKIREAADAELEIV